MVELIESSLAREVGFQIGGTGVPPVIKETQSNQAVTNNHGHGAGLIGGIRLQHTRQKEIKDNVSSNNNNTS